MHLCRIALFGMLAGCATPFSANWYLLEGRGGVHLVVMNHGDQTCKIEQLELNRINGQALSGRYLRLDPPVELKPGELLVRPIAYFHPTEARESLACVVPVEVVISPLEGGCNYRTIHGAYVLKLSGVLPNALPEAWEGCPTPPRASPLAAGSP